MHSILAHTNLFGKRSSQYPVGRSAQIAALSCLIALAGCSSLDSTGPQASAPAYYTQPPVAQGYQALPPGIAPQPGQLTHVVAPKETLWSIGKLYGVPHQDIMTLNHLSDPRKLSVGMTLVIPGSRPNLANIPLPTNSTWTHIVIHHSATKNGNASILDASHRKRGFKDGLGYHFVIDNGSSGRGNGQIEIGPRWKYQRKGAHCNAGGMNSHGIGICLVGDFTGKSISQSQMDSLVYLVDLLRRRYNIPMSNVIRHRDVKGKITACPGDHFPWTSFKNRLAVVSRSRTQQYANR